MLLPKDGIPRPQAYQEISVRVTEKHLINLPTTHEPYTVHFYDLNPEEKELHDAIEADTLVPVRDSEELKRKLVAAARQTNTKIRTINIRLPEKDLYKLKAKAAQEGIPYQTLVASILHKNV